MTAFDYKKAYKELYSPKTKPELINVPKMNFAAVRGTGNPNEEGGAYSAALGVLYAICYTIKMSKMDDAQPEGYFDYVMPPLEGFWWMEGGKAGIDYENKQNFSWISIIRLPEFVTKEVFECAREQAEKKKKLDMSSAEFFTYEEGLCVQCMHIGSFDDEPATLEKIDSFMEESSLINDISPSRYHHEIYLGDPRKTAPEKRRTVMRIPVRRA